MGGTKVSRLELLVREGLTYTFPEHLPVYNYRPDWLKNEETGKNLELDIFYPSLSIAVEVNSAFHKTAIGRERDALKRKECQARDIKLFQLWRKDRLIQLLIFLKRQYGDKSYEGLPKFYRNKVRKYKPTMRNFHKKLWGAKQMSHQTMAIRAQKAETESVRRRMQERINMNQG